MKKKDKVLIATGLIGMFLTLIAGITYAYWKRTYFQENVNIASTNCFNVDFVDANDISLSKAYPISDDEGMKTSPYTFTLTNLCSTSVLYQVNLETLDVDGDVKILPDEYVKASIKRNGVLKKSTTLNDDIMVETTLDDAKSAYMLNVGTLDENESATFELRIWLDFGVPAIDEVMNAVFKSKIVVDLSQKPSFVKANFIGSRNGKASSCISQASGRYQTKNIYITNDSVIPGVVLEKFDIGETPGKIYGYYVKNPTDSSCVNCIDLYIQSNEKIYANPNMANFFNGFASLDSIQGLELLDTSYTTDMSNMFFWIGGSNLTTIDVSGFDTSNVTNMSGMFFKPGSPCLKNIDVSNFDTSHVTDMSNMFYGQFLLESLDLSNFDTSNVTNMSNMFTATGNSSANFTLDVSNFNTSRVTDMSSMFSGTGARNPNFVLDVSNFDTSNVTNMTSMFSGITVKELDLSGFDTSSVTNMKSMFNNCKALNSLDVSSFDTSNVTNMSSMFSSTGYNSSSFTLNLGENFDTSNVTDMTSMFSSTGYNNTGFTLDLGNKFNTSNVTDMHNMFDDTGFKSKVLTLSLGDSFDTSNVTNMNCMFCGLGRDSEAMNLDLGENFDTRNVTDMQGMFNQLGWSATNFNLNLGEKFNTSNVTDMSSMFAGVGKTSRTGSITLGDKFDASKVTTMWQMFADTAAESDEFTIDLGRDFNTSNVTNMSYMFANFCKNCSTQTIVFGENFDTGKVTDMSYMFQYVGYTSPITINLNQINTSNVTDMSYMFYNSRYLNGNINIYTPSASSTGMFSSGIIGDSLTLNYHSGSESFVDSIIASKPSTANVVKGTSNIDSYTITLDSSDVVIKASSALPGQKIVLKTIDETKKVSSFKVNGTSYSNTSEFVMPSENVNVTDIVLENLIIVETAHNPYPSNQNGVVYYENTFAGATSITVELTYQTEGYNDRLYLYKSSSSYYNYYYGMTKKTVIVTIPTNYIKITFTTDGSYNNYYGFKAIITPNY